MQLSFRPTTPGDKEFCRRLHHIAYKDVIIRQFGSWDEELQNSFFEKEFKASCEIIELAGIAIGCLDKRVFPDHVSLSELQLFPEYQGRGIGTHIIHLVQKEALQLKKPLRLQALKASKARKLYERLDFVPFGETETHILMEWRGSGS